ncbi:hypothetical protein B0H11DRAFT_2099776 [Mycena galericulata]|nr:hypothetical protein B0H11DRAFT_2099776 [Mycena galericulata]
MTKPPGYRDNSSVTQMVVANQLHWRQFSEVPYDIWGTVATLCSRPTIASLCAVSRDFNSLFTATLYGRTTSPPLTTPQCRLLIKTLGDAQTTSREPHLAPLIRSLAVPYYDQYTINSRREAHILHAALRNVSGPTLRRLEWNMDKLGLLRRVLQYFPNLKEISVDSQRNQTCFDFIQIPNLEKLEYSASFYFTRRKKWNASWKALIKALKLLPLSSPLLDTLKLKLDIFPHSTSDSYTELVTTINQLRFSALTSLTFKSSMYLEVEFPDNVPVPNLTPFLNGHPLLSDLTLTGDGIRTDEHLAALPRLRSLTVSDEHFAPIFARAQDLERLSLLISDYPSLPTAEKLPPDAGPTVRRLNFQIGDVDVDDELDLHPFQLICLLTAFPNITHLNVALTQEINHYHDCFVALLGLEYLCIRYGPYVAPENRTESGDTIFPVAVYAAPISRLLPFSSNLSAVDLVLRGWRSLPDEHRGCPCCHERDEEYPDLEVDLRFCVDRNQGSNAELILVDRKVTDKKSWPDC